MVNVERLTTHGSGGPGAGMPESSPEIGGPLEGVLQLVEQLLHGAKLDPDEREGVIPKMVSLGATWCRALRGGGAATWRTAGDERTETAREGLMAVLEALAARPGCPPLALRLWASVHLAVALEMEREGGGDWRSELGTAMNLWVGGEPRSPVDGDEARGPAGVLDILGRWATADRRYVELANLCRVLDGGETGSETGGEAEFRLGVPGVLRDRAAVAELHLGRCPEGSPPGLYGAMPDTLFYPIGDQEFAGTLLAADALAADRGIAAWWRLGPIGLRYGRTLVTRDSSAGLAFGVGVRLLAEGRRPDGLVALTGALGGDGALAPLGHGTGIRLKARACVTGDWRLVVHEDDLRHVPANTVPVSSAATLDDAVEQVAAPVGALRSWSTSRRQVLSNALNEPAHRRGEVRWAWVRQRARVQELTGRPGSEKGVGGRGHRRNRKRSQQPVDWERFRGAVGGSRPLRAQVYGDLGYGKSTLARREALLWHELLIRQIAEGTAPDELQLAVRVPCTDVVTRLEDLNDDAQCDAPSRVDALVRTLIARFADELPRTGLSAPMRTAARDFLRRRFSADPAGLRVLCVFDGLDDILDGSRQVLVARAIGDLAARTHCSILVTGRTSANQVVGLKQVQLQPFTSAQSRAYIRARLGAHDGDRLLGRLPQSMRSALGNPLICSFLCAQPGDEPLPETIADLYLTVTRGLLKEDWRDGGRTEDEVESLMERMSEVAWRLRTAGTVGDIPEDALRAAAGTHYDEIAGTALLVRARGGFKFVHPSIGEYLGAVHLASVGGDDLLAAVDAHCWDPAWGPFFRFLASCTSCPAAMVDRILELHEVQPAHLHLLHLAATSFGGQIAHERLVEVVVEVLQGVRAGRSNALLETAAEIATEVRDERVAGVLASEEAERSRGSLRAAKRGERLTVVMEKVQKGATSSPGFRRIAAACLVKTGGERAIEFFDTLCGHDDGQVRRMAAEHLGRIANRSAATVLLKLLGNDEPSVVDAAVEALRTIGDPWVTDALCRQLRDPDAEVRLKAVGVLGKMGDPAAVGPLVDVLGKGDAPLKCGVAQALGDLGTSLGGHVDPAVKVSLTTLVGDADPEVRLAAVRALGRIGDPGVVGLLADVLENGDPSLRRAVVDAFGSLGEALRDTGEPAAKAMLLGLLDDRDPEIRLAAVRALGRIGDAEPVGRLVGLLEVGDAPLRRGVAEALGEIGTVLGDLRDDVAKKELIELVKDADWQVQLAAVVALGKLADPDATRPVVVALETGHLEVRCAAATTLGWIGSSAAVEPLVRQLRLVADPRVRQSSLRQAITAALVDLGGPVAAESLVRLLEDRPTAEDRRGSRTRRANDNPPTGRSPTLFWRNRDRDGDTLRTIEALGKIGERGSIDALTRMLDDNRGDFRTAAAVALVRIGAPEGADEVVRRLVANELTAAPELVSLQNWGRQAVEALGRVLPDLAPGELTSHVLLESVGREDLASAVATPAMDVALVLAAFEAATREKAGLTGRPGTVGTRIVTPGSP